MYVIAPTGSCDNSPGCRDSYRIKWWRISAQQSGHVTEVHCSLLVGGGGGGGGGGIIIIQNV